MAGPDTLGKVLHSLSYLKLRCMSPDCQHEVSIPAAEAFQRFGAHATPYMIRKRLKCAVCGSKNCDAGF